MRILLCHEKCCVGGLETWLLNLTRKLQRLGHEAELFFFTGGELASRLAEQYPIQVGDLADLLRLVRTRKFDVVHGAAWDWDLGISAVRRLGAKLVLTGQGRAHPAWNSTNCDALVGCSRWEAAEQQTWTDLPVQVVLNGIDTERFTPPDQLDDVRPIVAWVGRGADLHQKRIDQLAEIGPWLHQAGFRLWIADPDGPERVIPSVVERLQPIAEFWNVVPYEQMPTFLRSVAASGGCLLSTSRYEGLSIVQLEAQACGCPVAGPDLEGTNEAVRPEHGGMLFNPSLPAEAIARMIADALNDRETMQWRRDAARRFITTYCDEDAMVAQYVSIYESMPYPPQSRLRNFVSAHRASPLVNLDRYREFRWGAGYNQYLASRKLRFAGERDLAYSTALESLRTSPTLYARAERLVHLTSVLNPVR